MFDMEISRFRCIRKFQTKQTNEQKQTNKQIIVKISNKMDKLKELESQYYFRLYEAAVEMLLTRGHIVVNVIDEVDTFNKKFCFYGGLTIDRSKLKIQSQKSTKIYETIFVKEPMAGKQTITSYTVDSKLRYIIILDGDITPSAKRFIASQRPLVQVIPESLVLYRVLSHQQMPEIHHLSRSERDQFYQKSKVINKMLPKIQKDDPVLQYLGVFHSGDVLKFVRKSETAAGESVYFRVVV